MRREDIEEIDKIEALTRIFVQAVNPKKIYLFGSFATGKNDEDSDYDFYIIVDNAYEKDTWKINDQLEYAVGLNRHRALDIFVVAESYYEEHLRQGWPIEATVKEEGVLLYDGNGEKMA